MPQYTVGAEIEKVFSHSETGDSYTVDDPYFLTLEKIKQQRGEECHEKRIGERVVGISKPYGEEGLDNAFNLGESATGPFTPEEGGLKKLDEFLRKELLDVQDALSKGGGTILNMADHPLVQITQENYKKLRAPKPIYDFLIGRGWAHWEGIDAKAQNSPSTGVAVDDAVDALNVMLAAGSALIALYANSPFEQGRVTGYKESRLTIWDRMFGPSSSRGDYKLCQTPERPFENLRDYFQWMFGSGTNMYFVLRQGVGGDYKKFSEIAAVDGYPSILDFLAQKHWKGKIFGTNREVVIEPEMGHMELHQFTQFIGARIRYKLAGNGFDPEEFLAAMAGRGREVEELFDKKAEYLYIEGRDVGANFPDQALLDLPSGEKIAHSVVISPSAIQLGLIRNLPEAKELFEKYQWGDLSALRSEAIVKGLSAEHNGIRASDLALRVLEVAGRGLNTDEQWMLAYPEHVLSSGKNAADRALELFEKFSGTSVEDRIRRVVLARSAIIL